jgi:endonuclease-8
MTLNTKDMRHMEGPPVRLAADRLAAFEGKRIIAVAGNSRTDKERAQGLAIGQILSRGKNLLIRFPTFAFRIHFLMYGSYRINEEREGMPPRLSLDCGTGVMNFYNCAVQLVQDADIDERYPAELDITGERWSPNRTMELLMQQGRRHISDVLLDQAIYMGVGNIIKNEALFMAAVHPLSRIDSMPFHVLRKTTAAARRFSCLFYDVLSRGERLNTHLNVYRKRHCSTSGDKTIVQRTGETNRISFFCPVCQHLYA